MPKNQIFREPLNGKYDGVSPAPLLPVGAIAGGMNVRKVSGLGGWKPRRGCSLHNTTALETSSSIDSLHQYTHPVHGDYHFIAQCNSKLLESPTSPPTAAGATAWTDLGVTVGTTAGFSTMVEDVFFYADGSGSPIVWRGDTPYPMVVFNYDAGTASYVDITDNIIDNDSGTAGKIHAYAAADYLIVMTHQICETFAFDLGSTVNAAVETIVVSSWQSGAWSNRSATDGTLSGGATLAVDGSMTWTRSASDEMRFVNGVLGYAYKISWTGALDAAVMINSITTIQDAMAMTNKWNGIFDWVAGCLFYDQSADLYADRLGSVSNESVSQYMDLSSATTSDFIYIKTAEPAMAFGFGVDPGNPNDAVNSNIDQIDWWDGAAWTAATTNIVDTTMPAAISLVQTGYVTFDASAFTPIKRTLQGDPVPGFWYRVSWDVAIGSSCRVYTVLYAPFPEALKDTAGVVEFGNRLFTWGDKRYPNRLRFSAGGYPDCFCGGDSGFTRAFGDGSDILNCVKFYNELLVVKRDGIYLLEGYSKQTFGPLRVTEYTGIASAKSLQISEVGHPSVNQIEPKTISIWQETDGVYVFDGRKPKKVSDAIANYFNPEKSVYIGVSNMTSLDSYMDQNNNEYHLLLPTSELVYNVLNDEWYPPWEREIDLNCAATFRDSNNVWVSYGGSSAGLVMQLENDTADKTTANADKAITHNIKTRAIAPSDDQQIQPLNLVLARVWAAAKAQSAGTVTCKVYPDMASSGTTLATPEAMVLTNTGYEMTIDHLDTRQEEIFNFQLELEMATIDVEMEIWQIFYEAGVRGAVNK